MLKVYSDESYLSVPSRRSRVGGNFYFGDSMPLTEEDKKKGVVYTECSIIRPVVSYAAEASLAAFFINSQN